MDQVSEKKIKKKKEKQFANNHITMLINNEKLISCRLQESFTFIVIQIEYKGSFFSCLQ